MDKVPQNRAEWNAYWRTWCEQNGYDPNSLQEETVAMMQAFEKQATQQAKLQTHKKAPIPLPETEGQSPLFYILCGLAIYLVWSIINGKAKSDNRGSNSGSQSEGSNGFIFWNETAIPIGETANKDRR